MTDIIAELIDFVLDNKHPNLHVNADGLIATDGTQVPASWMNSVLDGRPVIPRTGYLVEFNALWYNALRFASTLLAEDKKICCPT